MMSWCRQKRTLSSALGMMCAGLAGHLEQFKADSQVMTVDGTSGIGGGCQS